MMRTYLKKKQHFNPYTKKKYSQAFLTTLALLSVFLFGIWWFNPLHIPYNFYGIWRFYDVLLFFLVSWVVWHPILMDVTSWIISLHIKNNRHHKPIKGLKVAFITTIVPKNEPVSLLHKCLPAMIAADYPHDTWLLDEGNDPEVKKICEYYGVHHFSRAQHEGLTTQFGKYTKTKGGNHNSWYDTHGNEYDIVAQIDTDFVPKKSFLTKTLGFFRDPKVAFVGTPQVYGNTHSSFIAKGADEQQYSFYGSVLRGLSGMGMTFLIGANHVIRVKALQDINHYTAHITEDLITGMKLHTKKWKSIYISEALAIGEGPFTWESYFSQQMRWAYGCMDILFHHSPQLFKKMGFKRAAYYFFLQQHYFSGITMALSSLLILLYFTADIRAADIDMFRFLIIYPAILLICWLMSIWLQRYNVKRQNNDELQIAGKLVSIAAWPIWFLAFLCVLVGKQLKYKVTPKGDNNDSPGLALNLFVPHMIFGSIALLAIISSFFTHRQNFLMMFWAASSASTMFLVMFTEQIAAFMRRLYNIGQRIEHQLLRPKQRHHDRYLQALRSYVLTPRDVRDDCIFLVLTTAISIGLYIRDLGFYSDDWAFLGNFTISKSQSIPGLFLQANTPNTYMRPVQNIYDAVLYKLFAYEPLGYQIVNSLVFIGIILMFYFCLRKLKQPRIISVAVPLVYAMLPTYTADRFWYAAYQATLSMLLYFFSLMAGLIALSPETKHRMSWKIASLVCLTLCALSYEVAIPLFILNVIIFALPFDLSEKGQKIRNYYKKYSSFNALIIIVMMYILIFKALTTTRLGNIDFFGHFTKLTHSIFNVNYVMLFTNFVRVWNEVLFVQPNVLIVGTAGILGVLILCYLLYVVTLPGYRFPSSAYMRNLAVIGVLVFILGYAIFFSNNRVGFSPTGIDNRVAISAAAGLALSLVGIFGWIFRLLFAERLAKILFSILVTLISVSGFVMINYLATYWISAYRESKSIVSEIEKRVAPLPANSTLLLDGVCPYIGPGIVFESQWDFKGALQTIYKDPTLQADIITPRLLVKNNRIQSQVYTFVANYPYKNLYIYNYKNKRLFEIQSESQAHTYFKTFNPDRNNGCPAASAGHGVDVF